MDQPLRTESPAYEGLIQGLLRVEGELGALFDAYGDLPFERIQPSDLPDAVDLRAQLADQVAALTHELASTIGFRRFRLQRTLALIDLRKRFPDLAERDLPVILARSWNTVSVVAFLRERGRPADPGTVQAFLSRIHDLNVDWATCFGSATYGEVAGAFRDTSIPTPESL